MFQGAIRALNYKKKEEIWIGPKPNCIMTKDVITIIVYN